MATTTLAPGLARKLKKVLETRTDVPDLLASLGTLSSFYAENSLQARRGLRTTIERRGLSINEEFLEASESAQKALNVVEAEVEGLASCCDRIAQALASCSSQTGDMVVATERLKHELESSLKKQELVENFLRSYQLTTDEVVALREDELDERFFKALARVQEIHTNCKVLLRTHHQRAGLELMDVMAVYQEGAYERLCRWVQAECRNLGDNDTPEVSDLLKTAARCLKERPVLFKYCAEEVANTRHNALFRRFIAALTRGGPGGMPRPIEVHAHDPMRYVGDMLAWLHQALASERELVAALFAPPSDDSKGQTKNLSEFRTASRRFSQDFEDPSLELPKGKSADMASVLDRIFEGVCRPFRVRVDQVLTSQPGLILAYKLSNLLDFYYHTISELLGPSAALSSTLQELQESAHRTLHDLLKSRGDKLIKYPPAVPQDLSPPPAVGEGIAVLLELLEVHRTAMVPAGVSKSDFEPILADLVAPLLQMCEKAAEAHGTKTSVPSPLRRLSTSSAGELGSSFRRGGTLSPSHSGVMGSGRRASSVEGLLRGNSMQDTSPKPEILQAVRHTFLINCLHALQQPLLPHEVASARVDSLGKLIQEHVAALAGQEVNHILEQCGLKDKLSFLEQYSQPIAEGAPPKPKLSSVEMVSSSAVAESLKAFFALVAGNSPDAGLPEFEQIQAPRIRGDASNRVTKELADAYEVLYRAVSDPAAGYKDASLLLRHTPAQMRTILGTDD